jgi:hypothetical protein
MQYGLRIIFETQLSHKTKSGQMTNDRGQKTKDGRQTFLKKDFGMQKMGYNKAQGPRPKGKNDFILFCLEP